MVLIGTIEPRCRYGHNDIIPDFIFPIDTFPDVNDRTRESVKQLSNAYFSQN